MTTSLFISDLHLDPGRPEGIQLFDNFIRNKAVDANQLFILGDLFEYWLGDDACEYSGYQAIEKSLAILAGCNTKVYFMHGNRDFLVGKDFASSICCQLLPDPTVFRLNDLDVLLMHGDSLCTDDEAHQQFRAVSRSNEWKKNILSKTIHEREEFARQLRMNSQKSNAEKIGSILDVNQTAVKAALLGHNVRLLIHGHTHRTAIHEFQLAGKTVHRIVLGDWYQQGNYLVHDQAKFSLLSYPDDTVLATVKISKASTTTSRKHPA
ncbi:UDP-2,3-diacylglucosamine hydrolase [bacterium BMS3Bbin11]|nr:UDP-2,3-diacylglucosamine hydrolase [bacterium BMS3Abin11]GBE45456.1 UDP-2,3-diacylglucosamine hydrolase [bacterium BMS3Bbin11]GMT40742.1 MAG: UDP-2,3-diacylglucosamine hydrolase [bacterium]HDH15191.1 UDP-2,3-diacylglucosamine diphosphatase [Gammaproteobacteria bacterium]HDZ78241.1 UDP-2,3-diacylglucosamine diphosphatase [Gammaproteobacteria bacterium]